MKKASSYVVLTAGIALLLTAAAGAQGFAFNLSAKQTVPRSMSGASGSCCGALLELENPQNPSQVIPALSISCDHDVENPTAAHIHFGVAGEAGPVVFPFDDPENISGLFPLSEENLAQLLTESFYVNVHSAAFPPGEIRGQVRFQSAGGAEAFFLPLAGDQVVPPVTTGASGRCLAALEDEELFLACYHDVAQPTAAHIHQGMAGANGPVVVSLGNGTSPILFDDELPADLIDPFLAGDLYVQVHSTPQPGGELRGQIDGCREGPFNLCLNEGRFQVEVDWRDFQGNTGRGHAVRESLDSGIFWYFDPDNAEVLVKVIDACNLEDFNSYWVFYAATTNVEFTLTVTDTQNDVAKVYTNDLGMPAAPITDTRAFSTCP